MQKEARDPNGKEGMKVLTPGVLPRNAMPDLPFQFEIIGGPAATPALQWNSRPVSNTLPRDLVHAFSWRHGYFDAGRGDLIRIIGRGPRGWVLPFMPPPDPTAPYTISEEKLQAMLAAAAAVVTAYKSELVVAARDREGALSVEQAAKESGWSRQTVTRMFEDEPGVLIISRPETLHKRAHRSIRIPRKVYERVLRNLANWLRAWWRKLELQPPPLNWDKGLHGGDT